MRRPVTWVVIILFGLVLFALIFIGKRSGEVTVRPLGQTNLNGQIHRVILVSNGTDTVQMFTAWAEWPTNGTWKRVPFEDYAWFELKPYKSDVQFVRSPGKETRIGLACFPKGSQGAHWIDWARSKVGLQPRFDSYKVYLKLE